jgi:PhnB protein
MATINPWINFNGNATDEFPIPEKEENKLMYIALPIGNNAMLIANDVPEFMGRVNERENRSKIFVSAASKEEADTLFHGLSAGGEVEGPIGASPWGTYAGMFRDKYGIEWIIEFSHLGVSTSIK